MEVVNTKTALSHHFSPHFKKFFCLNPSAFSDKIRRELKM